MTPSGLVIVAVPIALGLIMIGIGLGLVPDDFRRILREPRVVGLGVGNQIVLLPALAFAIAKAFAMEPELAVGLMILGVCPGGPISNLFTLLARGDVALSVTLTALSSLLTIATIPVLTNAALRHFLGAEVALQLPYLRTILQIFTITVLPIAAGMFVRHRAKETADRLGRPVRIAANGVLLLLILAIVVENRTGLPAFIAKTGASAATLVVAAMLVGFASARIVRLAPRQAVAISIESAQQNVAMALGIAASPLMLDRPTMATPIISYGVLVIAVGAISIPILRRQVGIESVRDGPRTPRRPEARD